MNHRDEVTGADVRGLGDRRRAGEALREQDGLTRAITDNAATAIFMMDADGRTTFMNPAAEAMTGFTFAELEGRVLHDAIHHTRPDGRPFPMHECTIARHVLSCRALRDHEDQFLRKDGSFVPVRCSASPIVRDGELAGIVLEAQDLTRQIAAERALRESEQRFRTMVDGLPLIVWVHGADGEQQFVNATFCEFFGVTGEETRGGRWQALMHADDADAYTRAFIGCVRDRRPFHAEVRVRRADGEWRWLESWARPRFTEAGEFLGFVGTSADVTDRKRADEALQASEQRLRLAMSAGATGAWDWDMSRDVAAISDSYRELFGIPPEQPFGYDSWLASVHPDDRERCRAYGASFFASADAVDWELEFRVNTPHRGVSWQRAIGKLHRAPDGKPLRFVGVSADVTERKRAEEALLAADRRKDEFLATLAHELRNPLAPMLNSIDLLDRVGSGEPAAIEARATMRRQLAHLVRLVDDLLDVSRISQDKLELVREPVDLALLVNRAVHDLRPMFAARGHELSVVLPEEPVWLHADATRLGQVLENLLNNACKYTPPGGRVSLVARREGRDALVSVIDNGQGVPPEDLSRVFGMFQQVRGAARTSQGGLGIGLSLVKRLVEMHGGTVEARSDGVGRGSEFVVRLPSMARAPDGRATDAARGWSDGAASSAPAPSAPAPTPHGRRILVVDDNRDAAVTLARLLAHGGNRTKLAHDGPDAIEAAEQFEPDVVLLDIGLPSMSGYDVCRAIHHRAGTPKPVMIALTGWGQDEDRQRSADAGFQHHLVKPLDYQKLCTLLEELERARTHAAASAVHAPEGS